MERSYDIIKKNKDSSKNDDDIKKLPKRRIDAKNNRYPYCLVWTPLPLITWILPMIGHTGICTGDGVIHDFAGPYYVSVDDMAFGNPTKYIPLEIDEHNIDDWDNYVEAGDQIYRGMMHNLCCNNCHSHCAHILNLSKYKGKSNYTMIHIWWMFMLKSKYVGCSGFFQTYAGFFIIWIIGIAIYLLTKFV